MTPERRRDLSSERAAVERLLADTPDDDVLERASLTARLAELDAEMSASPPDERAPARATLTFRGRPVVGTHGIFAEFGMKAVTAFTEAVAAMGASLTGPLAASGPLPNREQHQLLITRTALGSFGFELEEHRAGQLTLDDGSPVGEALARTQALLRGSLGTDDDLADSAADVDRRALDKLRAFLQTLVDNDAVCTVASDEARVSFGDVAAVRTSLARLSQDNLREETQELRGELLGVLPKSRAFELEVRTTRQVIRGKVAPSIADPDALNRDLHRPVRVQVLVTTVAGGRPRYVLLGVALDDAAG